MAKKIAVIGATGRLAPVVIRELAKTHTVTAIVRNPEKAKGLLPPNVSVKIADLQDINSLKAAIQGVDMLYLNLSAEAPGATFQPELDGVRNVLKAAEGSTVQRILKLSGLGAYRPDFAPGKTLFANEIRRQGQELIRSSGIPYTFFHATWFMESLELMLRQGDTLNGFKPLPYPFYWIAGADYARIVARAVELDLPGNRDYIIQGPEPVLMADALKRYARSFSPVLKVRETPIGMLKFIGWFVPALKQVAAMGEYFQGFQEQLAAGETWKELGAPTQRIEEFAREIQR
ncbi:MAG: NAD(P)H-binding protein [Bacteroidia bacterium]|nr:NAD(P)H-binding protein [Bacteroidia bacterium]